MVGLVGGLSEGGGREVGVVMRDRVGEDEGGVVVWEKGGVRFVGGE